MPTPHIIAIDPGAEKSGWVYYDGQADKVWRSSQDTENSALLRGLYSTGPDFFGQSVGSCRVVVEDMEFQGEFSGMHVFKTSWWAGRFFEAADRSSNHRPRMIYRSQVKKHHGASRSGDAGVRQAVLFRFGGEKVAKGTKTEPGKLYGVAGHAWQALALALYAFDQSKVSLESF